MKRIERPSKIRVGYRSINVAFVEASDLPEDKDGIFDEAGAQIKIADTLSPQDAAQVTLHEVIHACWRRISLEGDVEENAVEVLSENLAQVWRDNPSLIQWISAGLA